MLKRQDSSLSASRRQAVAAGTTPPPPDTHHAKAIGCMSGIIHLFSKYQNSNRRLTFGKKQEKRKPPQSPSRSAINGAKNSAGDDNSANQIPDAIPLTCVVKVLRSPTLPPEIRQSTAVRSPENSRTPSSSLVSRLMGLEDLGAASKRLGLTPEDTITEKRQRLMQALEKCNEDLEELKRIIKAVVQAADVRLQPPHSPRGHPGSGDGGSVAAQPCIQVCTESPADKLNIVVDELIRSSVNSHCVEQNSTAGETRVPQHRKPTTTKKPGEDDEAIAIARLLPKSTINESSLEMRRRAATAAASPPWSSRAMVESVEEVCSDIAWGEKREIGRIGLVVQDHVCRELIEELVKDLKSCSSIQPLPLEACKRKLCF